MAYFTKADEYGRRLLTHARRQKNKQRQYIPHMKIRGAIRFLQMTGQPVIRAAVKKITGSGYPAIEKVLAEMAQEEPQNVEKLRKISLKMSQIVSHKKGL